jgi:hypothetical protein
VVTLGSFIYGQGISFNPFETDISGNLTAGTALLRHEYGHCIQSQLNGFTYLSKYGVPSAASAQWTEIDAEFRADEYFQNEYRAAPIFGSYPIGYRPINAKWWEYWIISRAGYFGAEIVSLLNLNNGR